MDIHCKRIAAVVFILPLLALEVIAAIHQVPKGFEGLANMLFFQLSLFCLPIIMAIMAYRMFCRYRNADKWVAVLCGIIIALTIAGGVFGYMVRGMACIGAWDADACMQRVEDNKFDIIPYCLGVVIYYGAVLWACLLKEKAHA